MPQETDRLKLPLPLGNETVSRESINGIFEKIDAGVATQTDLDALREAVSKMDIPDASLTQKGKVQLSDVLNSNAKDKAATSSAVKLAFEEATSAKQLGVEQKNNVVAALNSIGVAASTSETWTQLINKMSGMIKATGNAVPAQVLAGATFSNASGNGKVGTIPNRGGGGGHNQALSTEVWQADRTFFRAPEGYYDGASWVYALTPDLRSENLLQGKSVLGIEGKASLGIRPGNNRVFAYDNKNVIAWPYGNVWVKFYTIQVEAGGTFRISFDASGSGGYGATYYYQIFLSGVPAGTLRSETFNTSNLTYTEDIVVGDGQQIEFMVKVDASSGRGVTLSNFRIDTNVNFAGTVNL